MVIPVAWPYVQKLGGDSLALGVLLAAYSITRIAIFVPLGRWSDRRSVKEPIIFCQVFDDRQMATNQIPPTVMSSP